MPYLKTKSGSIYQVPAPKQTAFMLLHPGTVELAYAPEYVDPNGEDLGFMPVDKYKDIKYSEAQLAQTTAENPIDALPEAQSPVATDKYNMGLSGAARITTPGQQVLETVRQKTPAFFPQAAAAFDIGAKSAIANAEYGIGSIGSGNADWQQKLKERSAENLAAASQTAQNFDLNNIDPIDKIENKDFVGAAKDALLGATMSAPQSLPAMSISLISPVAGAAATAITTFPQFGQKMQQLNENPETAGLSNWKKQGLATLSWGYEFGTEFIGNMLEIGAIKGAASGLGKKAIQSQIKGQVKKALAERAAATGIKLTNAAAIEGTEEIANSLAAEITDNISGVQDKSFSEMAYNAGNSFLIGAVSGGLMEGGIAAATVGAKTKSSKEIAKAIDYSINLKNAGREDLANKVLDGVSEARGKGDWNGFGVKSGANLETLYNKAVEYNPDLATQDANYIASKQIFQDKLNAYQEAVTNGAKRKQVNAAREEALKYSELISPEERDYYQTYLMIDNPQSAEEYKESFDNIFSQLSKELSKKSQQTTENNVVNQGQTISQTTEVNAEYEHPGIYEQNKINQMVDTTINAIDNIEKTGNTEEAVNVLNEFKSYIDKVSTILPAKSVNDAQQWLSMLSDTISIALDKPVGDTGVTQNENTIGMLENTEAQENMSDPVIAARLIRNKNYENNIRLLANKIGNIYAQGVNGIATSSVNQAVDNGTIGFDEGVKFINAANRLNDELEPVAQEEERKINQTRLEKNNKVIKTNPVGTTVNANPEEQNAVQIKKQRKREEKEGALREAKRTPEKTARRKAKRIREAAKEKYGSKTVVPYHATRATNNTVIVSVNGQKGETKVKLTQTGKKLIKKLSKDTVGKYGYGSIATYLAKEFKTIILPGGMKAFSRNIMGVFLPDNSIRTRTGQMEMVLNHELGHALYKKLIKSMPFTANNAEFANALVRFSYLKDTTASEKSPTEGFADWIKRYLSSDPVAEADGLGGIILENLSKYLPEMLTALQTARAAMALHQQRPIEIQLRARLKDPIKMETVDTAHPKWWDLWNNIMFTFQRKHSLVSAPFQKYIYAINKSSVMSKEEKAEAIQHIIAIRKQTEFIVNQSTDAMGTGTEFLYDPTGKLFIRIDGKHVEVTDDNGKSVHGLEYFKEKTGDAFDAFQMYNVFRSELARINANDKLKHNKNTLKEQPGVKDKKPTKTPTYKSEWSKEQLKSFMSEYETAHPEFRALSDELKSTWDALLKISYLSGGINKTEYQLIRSKYEFYYPLLRELVSPTGEAGKYQAKYGSKVNFGNINRSKGGARGQGYPPLEEIFEFRVRSVLQDHYTNETKRRYINEIQKIASDTSQPEDVRAAAKMMFIKVPENKTDNLKIDMELGDIAERLSTINKQINPEDIDLDIDLPERRKPGASVNVIGVWKDGRLEYYQVPFKNVFAALAPYGAGDSFGGAIYQLFGPTTKMYKSLVTSTLVFFKNNPFKDSFVAMSKSTGLGRFIPLDTMTGIARIVLDRAGLKSLPPEISQLMAETLNEQQQYFKWSFRPGESYGLLSSSGRKMAAKRLKAIINSSFLPDNRPFSSKSFIDKAAYGIYRANAFFAQPFLWIAAISGLTDLSKMSENAPRVGAAIRYMHKQARAGADINEQELEYIYGNITNNWSNQMGSATIGRVAHSLNFTGAQINGLFEGLRVLEDKGMINGAIYATAGVVAMTEAAFLLSYFLGGDDWKKRMFNQQERHSWAYMDFMGYQVPYVWGIGGLIQASVWNANKWLLIHDDAGREMSDVYDRSEMFKGMWQRLTNEIPVFGNLLEKPGLHGLLSAGMETLPAPAKAIAEGAANYSVYFDGPIRPSWYENWTDAQREAAFTGPQIYNWLSNLTTVDPYICQYIVKGAVATQYNGLGQLIDISSGGDIPELGKFPIVGSLFVKNPIGFASRPVQTISNADANRKMRSLIEEAQKLPPGEKRDILMMQAQHLRILVNAENKIRKYNLAARQALKNQNEEEAMSYRIKMTQTATEALAGYNVITR